MFRLYVYLAHPETRKDEVAHIRFNSYDEALEAARGLEAKIAAAPSSRQIVEVAANAQRLAFPASAFKRTQIISEEDDPNVPSFSSYSPYRR
jgi:hypothetical protein